MGKPADLSGSAGQNWSWGRSQSPKDNTYSDVNSGSTQFGLNTNVPLFTGLQLPNQYALSKLNLKAAIEDLNKAKEDIAINVLPLIYRFCSIWNSVR